MEFPTALLGVALGTILLPSLSSITPTRRPRNIRGCSTGGCASRCCSPRPRRVALAVLALPLITTLFHYGRFTRQDVLMTRQALVAYSVGLLGMILVKVLAPGFYARQKSRTPVKIAILTLVVTQVMNLAFIVPLRHAGLALAIGLGACLNAGLLYRKLREHGIYVPQPGWVRLRAQVRGALAAMGLALWFAMGARAWWLTASSLGRAAGLTGLVVLGAAVYFGALLAARLPRRAISRARRRDMTPQLERFAEIVSRERFDLARSLPDDRAGRLSRARRPRDISGDLDDIGAAIRGGSPRTPSPSRRCSR